MGSKYKRAPQWYKSFSTAFTNISNFIYYYLVIIYLLFSDASDTMSILSMHI